MDPQNEENRDVHTIAKYILSLSEPEFDVISNLKLQKVLYYCQGFSLAITKLPLFAEPIVVWQHGPVVISVYNQYNQYGSQPIPHPDDIETLPLSAGEKAFIELIYNECAKYSAWELRDKTHEEAPWRLTPHNSEIPHDLLRAYFAKQIKLVEPDVGVGVTESSVQAEPLAEFTQTASFFRGINDLMNGFASLMDLGATFPQLGRERVRKE